MPISSDAMRQQLLDDAADQSANREVFAAMRALLIRRIALKRPLTWIDATSLTRRERRQWIEIARAASGSIEAVYLDVPVAICKARNAARERTVPSHVIDLMAARFVPPSTQEGFSKVEVVSTLR
jgi:predicted kinase